jgi:GntR family transcriptional regulator
MSRPAENPLPELEPGVRKLLTAPISRDNPLPVYAQIANAIRNLVQSGTLAPGTMLPSERVLCEEFRISRMTLRQAYDVLEREHILHCERGRGTLISPLRMRKQQQEMRSFSEEIRARGGTPRSHLISFQSLLPSGTVREQLSLPPGEKVYRIERIRFSDLTPLALEVVQIPCYLCPDLHLIDLAKESLYSVLEGRYRLSLARSFETISATSPSARDRNLLELPRRTALLIVERRTYTASGTPVELAVTSYRGDLYQAVVHSVRVPANTEARP